MSEHQADGGGPLLAQRGPAGRALLATARAFSITGALVFVALVAMSVVSIVGRKLAAAPVPGDVELLQTSAAFASASFFALCHLTGTDVKVDFFTSRASPAVHHRLDAAASVLMGAFGALLAWRSAAGALVVRAADERTMILDLPLWIPQMAMVPGFVLLAVAGFFMASAHWRAAGDPAGAAAGGAA